MSRPAWLEIAVETIIHNDVLFLNAAQGPDGIWSVGYSSTGPGIKRGTRWTQTAALSALVLDLGVVAIEVDRWLTAEVSPEVFAALVVRAHRLGLESATVKQPAARMTS